MHRWDLLWHGLGPVRSGPSWPGLGSLLPTGHDDIAVERRGLLRTPHRANASSDYRAPSLPSLRSFGPGAFLFLAGTPLAAK